MHAVLNNFQHVHAYVSVGRQLQKSAVNGKLRNSSSVHVSFCCLRLPPPPYARMHKKLLKTSVQLKRWYLCALFIIYIVMQ